VSEAKLSLPVAVSGQVSRREAIRWVMAAVAASALPGQSIAQPARRAAFPGNGYGLDPKLLDPHKPGAFWPLTFNNAQRAAATALADVVIPADHLGPAASAVGVPAMRAEWVSAPYPVQQADRPVILPGLSWLDAESENRFGKVFSQLLADQKRAICDDICFTPAAKPQFRKAAEFFSRFRSLCASAYYATPEGWKAIGYVGNVPWERFDGPPPDVLDKLAVVQTVKDES